MPSVVARLTKGAVFDGIVDILEIGATQWRIFYSDGSDEIVELALGPAGSVLVSNGASAAPTWEEGVLATILHATATISTAATTELLAVAGGKICDIYSLDAFCDNGNSADQAVEFKFNATRIRKHAGIAPGSGFVVGGGGGKIAEGADGEDVDVVTGAAQNVEVAISYRLRDA